MLRAEDAGAHSVRAMVRAMKACQRVLFAVTVEGRSVGHVGHGGP
jgi:hypothetical protein